MKIRRKAPKVSSPGRPAFVIGYSFDDPSLTDLKLWFDLEYGGPLKHVSGSPVASGALVTLSHGPWSAGLSLPLGSDEAEQWAQRLGWRHRAAALVLPATGMPRAKPDLVLHAARLARGLTLLTEGTTYDVITGAYLNPSDWQDRPLVEFRPLDHVLVEHGEGPDLQERFYTKGLGKFGLDELETYRPIGLPASPVLQTLGDIATAVLLLGRCPNVGENMPFPSLGLSVQVVRHRTDSATGAPAGVRTIVWTETR
jgi:hypothetical protein